MKSDELVSVVRVCVCVCECVCEYVCGSLSVMLRMANYC